MKESFVVEKWMVEFGLEIADVLVLAVIYDYCGGEKGQCVINTGCISNLTGYNERDILKIIETLKTERFITFEDTDSEYPEEEKRYSITDKCIRLRDQYRGIYSRYK